MAQASVSMMGDSNSRKRHKKSHHSRKPSHTDSDTFLPSEYFITVKQSARIIVRANKKTQDGVEIKLQVSDKKNDDICDYETWLAAVKLTNVVAMARDQIIKHNPLPTKTTTTCHQGSVSPVQQSTPDVEHSPPVSCGTYLDQVADLETLQATLDSLC